MRGTRPGHLMLDTLPAAESDWVYRHAHGINFRPGQQVCQAYMPHTEIVFMLGGLAGHWVTHAGGGRIEVGICGPQSVIGAIALLGEGLAPYATIAQRGIHGLALPRPLFHVLPANTPTLTRRMGFAAMDDCLRLAEDIARQVFSPALARLAHRLLAHFEVCDTRLLEITHEELAEALALRRATITVSLQQLEEEKAVRAQRGTIELLNAEKLAEIAAR